MIKNPVFRILLIFVVLTDAKAWAEQNGYKNFASIRGERLDTSAEYHSSSYAIGYKHLFDKSGFSFGIDPKYATGDISGSSFAFQDVNLSMSKLTLHSLILLNVSYDSRSIGQRENSANLFANFGSEWTYPKFNFAFEGGKKTVAQEFQSLTSVRENLSSLYYLMRSNVLLAKNWQVRAVTKTYFISDANRRTDSDVGLMYGISPSWPWIWVGLGAEYMTNSISNTTGYWAPRQFVNFGPRFDLSFPVIGNFSFAMALNLNKYNDVDFGDGTGFYSLAKVVYGRPNSVRVEGGVETISSEQNSNRWTSSMLFLDVSCPF